MAAKYILAVLSIIFLFTGITRVIREGGRIGPASKAWLLVGGIFAAVSLWLWYSL